MSPQLHIKLLGEFAFRAGNEPVRGITPRQQSLLAYLILHRDAPQPRRRLAFLFWPDTGESQALTNLRRELHNLRRALGDAKCCLRVDSRTMQWNPDVPCLVDLAEFEGAMAEADAAARSGDSGASRENLARAAEFCDGEFLPNCYDAWIDGERERVRRAHDRALERLADACERDGDYPEAVRAAERLVSRDPLREANHARLIRLHGAAGDRAAALRAYERCAKVLDSELGVEPGPAASRARDAVMSTGPVGSTGHEPAIESLASVSAQPASTREPVPLIGRQRQRAFIDDWVEQTQQQERARAREVLLLLGEPGIGKTRLLDELAAELRNAGGRVIRGRGFEGEMVRPYGAWVDALRSIPREWLAGSENLGALIPEIRDASGTPSDRSRLFDAVVGWLARLTTAGGPVAVLIDDIQWLDEASAALLHYVARLLARSPVLLACAARPAELETNAPVSRFVRGLQRERRVCDVELPPMSRDDVAALARHVDGAADGDRVFADSGGNPLFALEIVHARAQSDTGSERTVEDLIGTRLACLDESARELVAWAAALGRGFEPSTAARVAGRSVPELLGVLERLERHGIIQPVESAGGQPVYDFAHDIVRRAAYARISEPRRRLIHLQIARALDEAADEEGGLAGDVAHHASLGGDAALAASASLTAAERGLRIFAYAEAAELARRGIEHTRQLDDRERIHLHMAFLRVFVAAGATSERAAELEEELRSLVAEARRLGLVDEEAIGYSLLSVLNYGREDFARVRESSIRAAEALEAAEATRSSDPATTARTLAETGACLASIEREMARAEALLLEAESLAARVGLELIDIPMGLGIIRHFGGEHAESIRFLQRALRMARAERDHFRACECLTSLVMLELDRGAPDRALTYCRELAPVAAKLKGGSEAPFSFALQAFAGYAMRDCDASESLDSALHSLRRLDSLRKLNYILVHAAEVDLSAGRIDAALTRAEEAIQAARTVDHHSGIVLAGALLIRGSRARGDLRGARDELHRLRDKVDSAPDLSARARDAFRGAMFEDPAPQPTT